MPFFSNRSQIARPNEHGHFRSSTSATLPLFLFVPELESLKPALPVKSILCRRCSCRTSPHHELLFRVVRDLQTNVGFAANLLRLPREGQRLSAELQQSVSQGFIDLVSGRGDVLRRVRPHDGVPLLRYRSARCQALDNFLTSFPSARSTAPHLPSLRSLLRDLAASLARLEWMVTMMKGFTADLHPLLSFLSMRTPISICVPSLSYNCVPQPELGDRPIRSMSTMNSLSSFVHSSDFALSASTTATQ